LDFKFQGHDLTRPGQGPANFVEKGVSFSEKGVYLLEIAIVEIRLAR
jgi:hypothetical protein